MKNFVAVISILLLVGCSSSVKIVRVPVPVMPPRTEIPAKPFLQTSAMDETTEDSTFVRALESDFINLRSYAEQLENLLKAYIKGLDENYIKGFEKEISID